MSESETTLREEDIRTEQGMGETRAEVADVDGDDQDGTDSDSDSSDSGSGDSDSDDTDSGA